MRKPDARQKRIDAADIAFNRPHFGPDPAPIPNPDVGEDTFPNHIANYSKGLKHNQIGEVDAASYQSLLDALTSGNFATYDTIQLDTSFSGPGKRGNKRLTNPIAGETFDLEGPDAQAIALLKQGATNLTDPASYEAFPKPPLLDSPEAAAEMIELYWMSILRDINFTEYKPTNDLVKKATQELSSITDFKGPKEGGTVTHKTLFRGFTNGDLEGPYISQFLLRGNQDDMLGRDEDDGWIKYGTCAMDQRHVVAVDGKDFGTTFRSWLAIQNGENRDVDPLYKKKLKDGELNDFFDEDIRFIRNARDLATYVHYDALYQAYLTACMYLLRKMDLEGDIMLNPGNPYRGKPTAAGFGTFGGPHILSLVCEVATRALKSVWFTKWFMFRRLRPEAYAGLVHLVKDPGNPQTYPLHPQVLSSKVVNDEIKKHNENQNKKFDREPKDGTYLLPLAFPEGSPTHPAYGAGHATVAGACVTILKAWFNENYEFKEAYTPNKKGDKLEKESMNLKLGDELNKLGANIAIGRNMAGVHWRSDYTNSFKLGEAIAIGILQEQKITYKETFSQPLTFTRFDGTPVSI